MKTTIIELDEIDSTNEYCKRYGRDENLIVIAKKQTAGKGTKGRSFISDEGGLYVSTFKNIENFDFSNTFSIMIDSCVAVCRTVESFALTPVVKWANDVLVNGKKICGTLIENRLSSGGVCRSVVGIGLNVNNALPDELKDIATGMSEQLKKPVNLAAVKKELVANLKKSYTVDDYKRYINWFGKEVILDRNGTKSVATAIDVGEDGRLVCFVDGKIERVSSAEISLRFI